MKKIIFTILAVSALFAGCKKTEISGTEGVGTMSLNVSTDDPQYVVTKAFTAPDVDPKTFSVQIVSSDGATKLEYPTLAEVPSVVELSGGDYTATVGTPNPQKVAWDHPVFSGTKAFKVLVGKASMVDITCSIANMVVTVNPTPEFLKEVTEFEITVESVDGKLVWDKAAVDDGKAGYFAVNELDVYVKGTRHNGQEVAQIHRHISDVKAKYHHILNIDAKVTGTLGNLNVTVDPTVVDKNENVDVPGHEFQPIPDEPGGGESPNPQPEPQPATSPKLIWPGNPDFAQYPLADTMSVELTVEAPEKIKSFVVKVQSPTAEFLNVLAGMVDPKNAHVSYGYVDLDLIGDTTAITSLADVGLPVGDALTGKTIVQFSLSGLLPMILGFSPDQGSVHTFTMNVTDEKGQSISQALPFNVK